MAATNFETEEDTITALFNAGWNSTTYPVAWPNIDFTPPANPTASTGWVRITVNPANARQAELGPVGARRYRHPGVVTVQVFTKDGTGSELSNQLCDTASAIFRGKTANNITYQAPYRDRVGSDDGWYQQNVVVPYYRDSDF